MNNKDQIYVGRKVYIKPSEFQRPKYSDDYVATEVIWVGNKKFKVKDDVRPNISYYLHNLKEVISKMNPSFILLSLPGDTGEDFDKKENLIITIRRHFNSRAVQQESEEILEKIVKLLGL